MVRRQDRYLLVLVKTVCLAIYMEILAGKNKLLTKNCLMSMKYKQVRVLCRYCTHMARVQEVSRLEKYRPQKISSERILECRPKLSFIHI